MIKIINDKYRKARGNSSVMYEIRCAECRRLICLYQKDGRGVLMRMYLDRMKLKMDIENGHCVCGSWFGVPYIYQQEQRPAIKLFVGKVKKRKIQ